MRLSDGTWVCLRKLQTKNVIQRAWVCNLHIRLKRTRGGEIELKWWWSCRHQCWEPHRTTHDTHITHYKPSGSRKSLHQQKGFYWFMYVMWPDKRHATWLLRATCGCLLAASCTLPLCSLFSYLTLKTKLLISFFLFLIYTFFIFSTKSPLGLHSCIIFAIIP